MSNKLNSKLDLKNDIPKIKKKRGRKPKNKTDNSKNVIKVKKKRGRKPKFHYNVEVYKLYNENLFESDKKFRDLIVHLPIDIEKIGHKFQSIDMFPKGTNVELYIIKDNNNVNARVFERGVGETLACGSGAVAIFYSLLSKNLVSENIWVNYPGGKLNLAIKNDKIYLSGEIKYL